MRNTGAYTGQIGTALIKTQQGRATGVRDTARMWGFQLAA